MWDSGGGCFRLVLFGGGGLGSFWNHLGIILGSYWDYFGVILGSFWDHFGIILGSFWNHFGIILRSKFEKLNWLGEPRRGGWGKLAGEGAGGTRLAESHSPTLYTE